MPRYTRDRATWTSFGTLFGFGLLNAVLGPVLPYLRAQEHLSYVVASLHQVAFAVGGMTAGLLAVRSTAGRRPTVVVGLTGAALAAVLLAYGRLLPVTLLAALLVSAFGTTALIRVWGLLSDLHRAHRSVALTEGEIAVSLAGVLTPGLVGVCAAVGAWQLALVVLAVAVLASTVAVLLTPLPPSSQAGRAADDGPAGPVRSPHTARTLTTIFAVVALEFTLSFWAASYLHDDVGLAVDTAAALVSALYAANLVGRVLTSRVARRLAPEVTLRLGLALAAAGVPVLLLAHGSAWAAVGLFVAGTGIGSAFPLASSLHIAGSRRTADQALGQNLTVAGLGQITGPLLAGAVAQLATLRTGLLVLPLFILLALLTARPVPDDR